MGRQIYPRVVIVMSICSLLINGHKYFQSTPCGRLEVPSSDSNQKDKFCRPDLTPPWELQKPRRCVCRPGLVRNAWGDCITGQECLQCKRFHDKDFNVCRSKCPLLCNRPIPGSCSQKCDLGCDCPPGSVRDPSTNNYRCTKTTICVPTCPPKSTFQPCISTCAPRCGSRQPSICVKRCQRGDCVCLDGYAKTELNGQMICVPQQECYRYRGSTTVVPSPLLGQIRGAINSEGNTNFAVGVLEQPLGSHLPITVVNRFGGISVNTVEGSSWTSNGGVGGGLATGRETADSAAVLRRVGSLPMSICSRPNGLVLSAVGLSARSSGHRGVSGGRTVGRESVGSPNSLQRSPYLTGAVERIQGGFLINAVGAPTAISNAQGGVGGRPPTGTGITGSPAFRQWHPNLPSAVGTQPGGAVVSTVGLSSLSYDEHGGVGGGVVRGSGSVGSPHSQPRHPYLTGSVGSRAGGAIINNMRAPSVSSNGNIALAGLAPGRSGSLDSQERDGTSEQISPGDIPSPYTTGSGRVNVVIASIGIPPISTAGTESPTAAAGAILAHSPASARARSVDANFRITGMERSSSSTSISTWAAPSHNNAAYTTSATSTDRSRTARGNVVAHLGRVPSGGATHAGRTGANAGTISVHSPGSALNSFGGVGIEKEQSGISGVGGSFQNIPEIAGPMLRHSTEGSKPGIMSIHQVDRQEQRRTGYGSARGGMFLHGVQPITRSLPGVTSVVGTESPGTTMPVPAGLASPVYGGVRGGAVRGSVSRFASGPPRENAAENETGTTRPRRIWVEAVPSTLKPGPAGYGGIGTGAVTNSITAYGNQPLEGTDTESTQPPTVWADVVPSNQYRRKAKLLGVSEH
uniref:Putative tritil protein n=1 Tax=Rhipicephalus pulchellus TaxID=72859 RepID=L7LQ68_RHIPC